MVTVTIFPAPALGKKCDSHPILRLPASLRDGYALDISQRPVGEASRFEIAAFQITPFGGTEVETLLGQEILKCPVIDTPAPRLADHLQ